MINVNILGRDCLLETWDPKASLLDVAKWQLGAERIRGQYPGWQLWVGPFALTVCKAAIRPA